MMDSVQNEMLEILSEVIQYVDRPDTELFFSNYASVEEAIASFTALTEKIRLGEASAIAEWTLLFAPTGDLQELSLDNGWANAYLKLAERGDRCVAQYAQTFQK